MYSDNTILVKTDEDVNVVFLDFDGVINIPLYNRNNGTIGLFRLKDKRVNDIQSINFLNELCLKTGFQIVVTSVWGKKLSLDELRNILYNSGLKEEIQIIGKISQNISRTKEIEYFLKKYPNIKKFVILDDSPIFGKLYKNSVKCNRFYGFKEPEYSKALAIIEAYNPTKEKYEFTKNYSVMEIPDEDIDVLFLDIDGVVNIPLFDEKMKYGFYYSSDEKVNDSQSIDFINLLCIQKNLKIIVSSAWSENNTLEQLRKILYNSGLSHDVAVVGKIEQKSTRAKDIYQYLKKYHNVKKIVILDDDKICGKLSKYWVNCCTDYGFKLPEYKKALSIIEFQEKAR